MKRYYVFLVIVFLCLAACSKSDSDTATVADAQSGDNSTIDYQAYEGLDVNAYDDFDALPVELKDDVYAKAAFLVGLMDKTRAYYGASQSAYSNTNAVSCLLYSCWKPMVSCVIDGECRSQLMSLGDCVFKGGDEMMLCFIAAFAQPSDKILAMMSCLGGSGCLPEPVLSCALPTNRSQIAPVTLADLEGEWYVVRGLSPVYDCFSGQRYTFHQISETQSTYDYTYFPVDKNTPVAIKCTTTAIPFASDESEIYPGRFRVNYTAYGMPGVDDWYVLSHPNDNGENEYVLIYYCGASAMDSYVGGIVLSRSLDTSIPQDILNDFEFALANAGISDPVALSDFCTPDNSGITYDGPANTWESALFLPTLF